MPAFPALPTLTSTAPMAVWQPRRAIVTVPPAKKNGTVRAKPSLGAEIVHFIPNGEIVEVEDRQVVQDKMGRQVWFRVRGTVFGKPVEGWMHSDIIKMTDEPRVPSR